MRKEPQGKMTESEYIIDEEFEGSRLDRFVRSAIPGISFPAAQSLIRKKKVLLNGRKASGTTRLSRGDTVQVRAAGVSVGNERAAGAETIDATGLMEVGSEAGTPEGSSGDRTGRDGETDNAAKDGLAQRAWKDGVPPHRNPLEKQLKAFGKIGEGVEILYEDEEILVINKPSGLVVQPGNLKLRGSLLDLLEEYRRRIFASRNRAQRRKEIGKHKAKPGGGGKSTLPPFRFTPVHRLDRGTSGALAIAKTRRAARTLSAFFKSGRVEKIYMAVVMGEPEKKSGVIDSPIKTTRGARSSSSTGGRGKPSVTRYRMKKQLPGGKSLLEIVIETGRTHQIRVHLASIGLPVAGDRQYSKPTAGFKQYGRRSGSEKRSTKRGTTRSSTRLMLHSSRLVFEHPTGKGQVEVTAPLPDDFFI